MKLLKAANQVKAENEILLKKESCSPGFVTVDRGLLAPASSVAPQRP